jgi:branched-chain amino acid transport system ATP-binding protein
MNAYSIQGSRNIHEAFERAYEAFPLLERRRHQRAGSLSGGERRFLELARVVMLKPSLVLLDEPSIGVAPKAIAEIYRTIAQLHDSGISFLIVEQNVRLALNVSSNTCVLEAGQLRWQGPPAKLKDDNALRELYLGIDTTTGYRGT